MLLALEVALGTTDPHRGYTPALIFFLTRPYATRTSLHVQAEFRM